MSEQKHFQWELLLSERDIPPSKELMELMDLVYQLGEAGQIRHRPPTAKEALAASHNKFHQTLQSRESDAYEQGILWVLKFMKLDFHNSQFSTRHMEARRHVLRYNADPPDLEF